MKNMGIVGHKGKLGSLLTKRSNFFVLDCDVTDLLSIEKAIKYSPSANVIVNCAGISSIDECEGDYDKAIKVNVHGLHNLHKVFGNRVLNISSDHVFSGKSWWLPNDNTKSSPTNLYGWSKVGAEAVSKVNGGKTIRLSRSVSMSDRDIIECVGSILHKMDIDVPSFFYRNYIHRQFVVDGIEYLAKNWDSIKFDTINYCGTENFSMYLFMTTLMDALGLNSDFIKARDEYSYNDAPRPKRGGLKMSLARKLGFPMYSMVDTINKLVEEYNAHS